MERKVIWTILIGILLFVATFFFCINRLPQSSYSTTSQPSPVITPLLTAIPAQLPTTTPQIDNDQIFLSAAVSSSTELTTAAGIFEKIIAEENLWLANVDLADAVYQAALTNLEIENGYAADLTRNYYQHVQYAGGDVSLIRIYTMQYNQDKQDEDELVAAAQKIADEKKAARDTAMVGPTLETRGYDLSSLSSTCTRSTDRLTPIQVSPKLQPTKDKYLDAISDLNRAIECVKTADNYFNQKNIAMGTEQLKLGNQYLKSATNKFDSVTLLLHQYTPG